MKQVLSGRMNTQINASDNCRVDNTMAMRSQLRNVVVELPLSRQCFDVHFLYYQSMTDYPNF
jgi:hypothetical protein